MKILLRLSYIGTGYCGYQVQPNGVSVQQKLNEAAKQLFGYECDVVGCSRTDSGVHANEFCITITKKKENFIETAIPISRIPQAMSHWLPSDIAVYSAEAVDEDFHPRYDVKYKEYIYKILNRQVRDPFFEGRAWHCPKAIDEEALANMQRAAACFVGKKDFTSFMATGSKIVDATREIYSLSVERKGGFIELSVSADGFLYNMVRIIAGTLIKIGMHEMSDSCISSILEAENREKAGPTAPAQGLTLVGIEYPNLQ